MTIPIASGVETTVLFQRLMNFEQITDRTSFIPGKGLGSTV